jgi:hypothetical protein
MAGAEASVRAADWRPDGWLLARRSPRYARPKVRRDDGGDGKAPSFTPRIGMLTVR